MAVANRRRRVDWPVILRNDPPVPKVVNEPAPSSLVALLSSFDEILALDDPDAILRRAVELARERIGLERVGIFMLDRSRGLMLGSWGSDLDGALVDEHQIMFAENHIEREAFRRAEDEGAHFTVFDDCPIVAHRGGKSQTSGTGWVTCTPIRSGHLRIGMLFNDAGASGAPVDVVKQAYAAILCSLLGTVLDPIRGPAAVGVLTGESSARRLTTAAAEMLAEDSESLQRGDCLTARRHPRPPQPRVSNRSWECRWSSTAIGCGSNGSRRCWAAGPETCWMPPSRPASAATPNFTACSARSATGPRANTSAAGLTFPVQALVA